MLHQSIAQAAAPRTSWVESEVYQFNHPFAAQLPQELATKMQKMAVSPFAFYRGTAHLFYRDLVAIPASRFVNYANAAVWLEGDMHLQNMGAFRDSNGNNVFDTTDFDEGYLGPYIWDVQRMAVGIMLAAKERGLSAGDRQDVVRAFLDAYINKLSDFKGSDEEKSYRLDTSNTSGYVKDLIQKASGQTRSDFLDKYTTVTAAGRVFKTSSELQPVSSSVYSSIASAMSAYVSSISASKRYSSSYYTLKDVRLKLGSGTGSLGRYRYFLLIEGPSSSDSDDRILEMKQEVTSSVAIAAPERLPASSYSYHQGKRVAMTLKAMLNNADVLVGYTTVNNIAYMIREKSPYQADFDYLQLSSKSQFMDAVTYQGRVLAKNHALADKDYDPSIVPYSEDKEITDAIDSDKSGFKDEIVAFAVNYATQVEYDYTSFVNAYNRGAVLY